MIYFKVVLVLLKFVCLYADNTTVKYKRYFGATDKGGSALVDCAINVDGTSIGLDYSVTSASCTGLNSSWLQDKQTEVDHIYMQKVRSDECFDPPLYLYYHSSTDLDRFHSRIPPIEFLYGSTIAIYFSMSNSVTEFLITLRHYDDYLLRIIMDYKLPTVQCIARYNGKTSDYSENTSYQFILNKVVKITLRTVLDGYEVYFDDEWLVDFTDTSRPHKSTDITRVASWVNDGSSVYLHRMDFTQ